MPNRNKRKRKHIDSGNWSTDQDCLLIKYIDLPLEELMSCLPYERNEIIDRINLLGLNRKPLFMENTTQVQSTVTY